ncbi:penicillin-binding transpeptidase domain-containing protein [Streptomyces sp. RPT161]|uniref:penicillin-binding transpeptidase domain-containing protein n=1 Tax=Streptomyces sp. RPT161 TaxID=3015993 RepID=UPI0022B8F014|nr:penicillin-binding transpeptidase domain-containing protein [Streptomyces sp. RPT161]
MIRHIRHAAVLCLLLLVALLVNATRVQVVNSGSYNGNPANRRTVLLRYGQPRGDILVGGATVTGSRDTGGQLRYRRTYRDGPLYAPVTGYASQTYGTTLLENAADAVLSGTDPRLAAFPLWNAIARERNPGGRVRSTVLPSAQQAAFSGLGGRKGAVAAVEPATGRILALVSSPSYDPGSFAGTGASDVAAWQRLTASPDQPLLNRAIRQTYPPGSAFKVVTAAAALDSGRITDIDAATDSPDPYPLPNTATRLTNESGGCSNATLRYAFQVSCNTVFGKLGDDVGLPEMVRTARSFGFDDRNLGIPSGVSESVFDTSMNAAQLALSSIGQYDTRATPLQMAMVAAAVADGGTAMRPYLIDRETRANGSVIAVTRPNALGRAMSSRTASLLQRMMLDVVNQGTGTSARIPGVDVGGKTGTAQHGVGNMGTPYAWFISWARPTGSGTAPVAVAVVVEDAAANRADISGGGNAAPIAQAVMRAVLGR